MKLVVLGVGLMARSIKDVYPDAILLGHDQVEVTSLDSLVAALTPHKPDVIVNSVAVHRIGQCEDDPMYARLVNEIAAGRIAKLAPTIYLSTDYVWNDDGPHDEMIPGKERPRSVYGQTKLAGELATLAEGGIVVRLSAVFGHHQSHKGPSFPDMVTSSFDPLKLPTDQRFCPTYAPDAARRIVGLARDLADPTDYCCPNCVTPWKCNGPHDPLGGFYHAANAGSTTWYEFATQITEVTRHKRTITGHAVHDRLRPGNSAIRSTRLPPLPHWTDALTRWAVERDRLLYEARVSPLRANP